ncbi:MAG: sensor histidine kinase [Mediterranea sp.]|jgi:signal transduction histidine kinase|nr:sensor histidine kinase [Mediterranea sp.]
MKLFTIIVFLLLSLSTPAWAQENPSPNRGDEYMQQAESNLKQKEYIKARYLYLKAYEVYIGQSEYEKAVACGMQVSYLYRRENYFQNASEICNALDYWVQLGEKKLGKKMPELFFRINEERLSLSVIQKRPESSKAYLALLEANAKAMPASDTINEDLLYARLNYYYTFGRQDEGDKSFEELIAAYKQKGEYDKISDSYKNLVSVALKTGNNALVVNTYDRYMAWSDSVNKQQARKELDALQQKYDDSLRTVEEKEASISSRQIIIIGLCVLAVILVAILLLGAVVLLRFIVLTKKQKKTIAVANEHNDLKNLFIRNISEQVEPTLETLDATHPGVQALRSFSQHIQEMSDLENTLSETFETGDISVNAFCDKVMEKIKNTIKPDVITAVNAPKLTIKGNSEQLERILLHLLTNAALYTPEGGKIWLDYKKRGAHVQQFIVSDTGSGIPEEMRENLFRPFTEVKDLTKGDGLGLPICSLIAIKMNGTLSLDTTYTKGSRFVLELRT